MRGGKYVTCTHTDTHTPVSFVASLVVLHVTHTAQLGLWLMTCPQTLGFVQKHFCIQGSGLLALQMVGCHQATLPYTKDSRKQHRANAT